MPTKKRKAPPRPRKPAPTREVVSEDVKQRARKQARETISQLEREGAIKGKRKPSRAVPKEPKKQPVYAPIKQAAIGTAKERYTAAVRELREAFHGFDARDGYPLTRYEEWTDTQKRKVRRYYTTLDQARSHVHQKVTREDLPEGHQDRATFEKLLDQTQQREHVSKWKVAYVPVPGARKGERGHKAPVDVMVDEDTGELWIEQEGYRYREIDFDMVEFFMSPSETLANAIAEQSPHAGRFQIIAGKHKILQSFSRTELLHYIEWMLVEYEDDVGEWFGGVVALEFDEGAPPTATTAKGLADRYGEQQRAWKAARRFYRAQRAAIEQQLRGVRYALRRQKPRLSEDEIVTQLAFRRDYLLDQMAFAAAEKGYPPEDELK